MERCGRLDGKLSADVRGHRRVARLGRILIARREPGRKDTMSKTTMEKELEKAQAAVVVAKENLQAVKAVTEAARAKEDEARAAWIEARDRRKAIANAIADEEMKDNRPAP